LIRVYLCVSVASSSFQTVVPFRVFPWLVVFLLQAPLDVAAQAYPNRPVRIISPFAAGGSNDIVARVVAPRLTTLLGQPFVVENRPGAGGVLGTELGARAAPDGYTLTMVTNATLAIAPALRQVPYDPVKDFAPVGLVGLSPYIVIVHPSVPVHNIKQLVALVKSRPGQVDFGSGGVGTPGHLAGAMLNTMTGIRLVHVPYRAGNLALNDLLGGHISVTFSTTITSTQFIRAGKVRALAATSTQRIPAFPDLPTVAESGVPGYEFTLWLGLAAPAGTPDAAIQPLQRALGKALHARDLQDQLAHQSVDTLSSTPQDLAEKIKRDIVIYAKVVKDSGARAE
jgi:tripartite-type tricarboxylate transporter receptor subunit TctC